MIAPAPAKSVLPTRKPRLLFRLSVVFLLRLAERRFCGLLFQEPPRTPRRQEAVPGFRAIGRIKPAASEDRAERTASKNLAKNADRRRGGQGTPR